MTPSSAGNRPGASRSDEERLARLRERHPFLDHLLRMQKHYSEVKGGQQAGAITYFGFLSFFPIMALAFFAVGWVANVFPDAQDALLDAIETVLPGIVGDGANEISLADIQDAAGAVGVIGLVGVLYSGLGWLSAMRDALFVVFEKPAYAQPSFVIGKLRDLITLALVGLVLVLSVGVSGGVTGFSEELLDLVGLDAELGWVLTAARGAGRTRCLHGALLRDVPPARRPRRTESIAVVRRALRSDRLRGAQAAVERAALPDRGAAGVPGVRHRADPAGLDQLLLPRRPVRRLLGLHDRRRPALRAASRGDEPACRRPEGVPSPEPTSRRRRTDRRREWVGRRAVSLGAWCSAASRRSRPDRESASRPARERPKPLGALGG